MGVLAVPDLPTSVVATAPMLSPCLTLCHSVNQNPRISSPHISGSVPANFSSRSLSCTRSDLARIGHERRTDSGYAQRLPAVKPLQVKHARPHEYSTRQKNRTAKTDRCRLQILTRKLSGMSMWCASSFECPGHRSGHVSRSGKYLERYLETRQGVPPQLTRSTGIFNRHE